MTEWADINRHNGGLTANRKNRIALHAGDVLIPFGALLAYLFGASDRIGVGALIAGVVGVSYGLAIFLSSGGNRITAPGLFGLGYAVFIAGVSLYWIADVEQYGINFVSVQIVTLLSLWLMDLIFWRNASVVKFETTVNSKIFTTTLVVCVGVVPVLAMVMIAAGGATIVQRLAAGAVSLMLIVLSLPRGGRELSVFGMLSALAVFAIFYKVFFDGSGRLVLVAIVMTVLTAASGVWDSKFVKPTVVAAVIPSVLSLAAIRRTETSTGEVTDGLGSVVNPFPTMVELATYIQNSDQGGWNLDSFIAVFLLWVPREIWPDKPVGFGRELVYMLRPELLDTPHSMAALFLGEWVYAFGLFGLVPMIVTIGGLIAILDRLIVWSCRNREIGARGLLVLSSAALVAGQAPTIVWSGLFSSASRSLQGVLAILVILTTAFLITSTFRSGQFQASNQASLPAGDIRSGRQHKD